MSQDSNDPLAPFRRKEPNPSVHASQGQPLPTNTEMEREPLTSAYHFSVTVVQRGTALDDNVSYMEQVQSFIVAPEHAPDWVLDREELWKRAALAESERSGPVARVITLSLPRELNEAQCLALVQHYADDVFAKQGMVAEGALHYADNPDRTFYARIMLTMRELDGDHFATQQQQDWNSADSLLSWRAQWAEYQNDALNEIQQHRPLETFESQMRSSTPERENLAAENERLKASNAELLEALRNLVDQAQEDTPIDSRTAHFETAMEDAFAAITKATMKQSEQELSSPMPERDIDLEPDL